MSGWIKLDKDMVNDPRLLDAAMALGKRYVLATRTPGGGADLSTGDALRFARNALLGALATLWEYADTHIRDDDTLPLISDAVDALVGIDGFYALMPRDWIVELDGGAVQLPGYCDKNELIAKRKRAADAKRRQAALRARRNGQSNGGVTHNAEHSNALRTRDSSVTKCVDLDLDQYRDQDSKKREGSAEGETARATRSPATHIRDDFALTPERASYASDRGLDPAGVLENFRDYWLAASGAKARKHDWEATWRIWCRRQADDQKRGKTPRKTRYEEIMDKLHAS